MESNTFGLVIGWIIGAAVGLALLYFVIYYSVLNALRAHTVSSTTGVSVVSAVPLQLAPTQEPPVATGEA